MSDKNILKEYIEKLVEIEKEETKYKNIFNNLKKDKDTLNNNIINYLEKNSITDKDIIFGNKKIKYSLMKTQDNITKKLILERLKKYFNNEIKAIEITNYIYSDRNSNQKPIIKISNINDKL